MRAHPLLAILLVVAGMLALEAMLPVWPEVTSGPTGLGNRGANLFYAVDADLRMIASHGAMEVLRAIDAAQYLGISLMGALALGSGWGCARYLRAHAPEGHER